MSTPPLIGFFDSGIGGLSVLRHAPELLGDAAYLYVADSAYAPYGAQPLEVVQQRSQAITRFLVSQGAQAIVIACNTATAVAAELIRAQLTIPVIAMEPAIKPAVAQSTCKRIVVLATASTIGSERYRLLKQDHLKQGEVVELACHRWVEALERGYPEGAELADLVAEELQPIVSFAADTYILGCTHFPFLYPMIRDFLGPDVHIIDPAKAVIGQLARRLGVNEQPSCVLSAPKVQLFSSGNTQLTENRLLSLMNWRIKVNSLNL